MEYQKETQITDKDEIIAEFAKSLNQRFTELNVANEKIIIYVDVINSQKQTIAELKSIISDFMISLNTSGSAVGWERDPHINAAWDRGAKIFRQDGNEQQS